MLAFTFCSAGADKPWCCKPLVWTAFWQKNCSRNCHCGIDRLGRSTDKWRVVIIIICQCRQHAQSITRRRTAATRAIAENERNSAADGSQSIIQRSAILPRPVATASGALQHHVQSSELPTEYSLPLTWDKGWDIHHTFQLGSLIHNRLAWLEVDAVRTKLQNENPKKVHMSPPRVTMRSETKRHQSNVFPGKRESKYQSDY